MEVPQLSPIKELHKQPQDAFIHACNVLFEAAPPLARELYARRPYVSYEQLIDTAGMFIEISN